MIRFASLTSPIQRIHLLAAIFIAFVMEIAIGTALFFEHILGYLPCKLCLDERIPYYIGIPIMIVTIILSISKRFSFFVRLLFVIVGLMFLYNLGLSIYHAGAEYKFWPGPTDCAAAAISLTLDAKNLLSDMTTIHPPSCDTASGYFLGLSFAGWNGVSSLFLMLFCFISAFMSCTYVKKK